MCAMHIARFLVCEGPRSDATNPMGTMPSVKMVRSGKRHGFECAVCRTLELFADSAAAKAARMKHVATAPHRSALRAARRE